MGAPGSVLFCSKGHMVRWWDEHLYWTDEMFKELKKQKEEGCICGDKTIIEISHYGGINDCICLNSEQNERGIRLTGNIDTFLVPFKYALNKDGNSVKGIFTQVKREVYYIPNDVRNGSRWEI